MHHRSGAAAPTLKSWTLQIITGCMRPTETTFLHVLAGITPHDIRREARVAKIIATAKNNPDHILHLKVAAADAACQQRLVPRRPISSHAARLYNDNYDPDKAARSDRVDSGPPLIQTACTQSRPVLPPGGRSPPQAVGETESPAMWHRACWRHVETLGVFKSRPCVPADTLHSQCSMWSWTA